MVERRDTKEPINNFMSISSLVIFLLTVGGVFAAQSSRPDEVPVWSQEMVPDLGHKQSGMGNQAGVAFLSGRQIIVYAVVHDLRQLSSRENPDISSPFRLHLWLLDAGSGKLSFARDWGTRAHDSAVQVTADGVLIKRGGIVKLYSPDFTQVRDLPLALDVDGLFFTSVSASGKTIAVSRVIERGHDVFFSHFDMLDSGTLKIRSSWDVSPALYSHFSISDDKISALYRNVVVAEFGNSNWNTILDTSKSRCLAGGQDIGPTLVTDESLVVRDCNDLLLWTPRQGFQMLGSIDGRTPSKKAVAQDGRFVAVSVDTIEVKHHLLTEYSSRLSARRIAVYDLALRKLVLTVNIDPLPRNDYGFALSPDGDKLAILSDRKVSVYAVPAE